MSRSDGSTADYYELPEGATQLQDLISHRNLNAQLGEIFRACYRFGMADHSDQLRDAKKILFYAKAEVERLEKLLARAKVDLGIEVRGANRPFEPALAIDDDSPRAQILGQNGEMASEVYAAIGRPKDAPQWINAPTWATHLMERLGVYEWAMMHDGRYWDDEDTEDAGRFLLANEADGTPWTVIEARPCQ